VAWAWIAVDARCGRSYHPVMFPLGDHDAGRPGPEWFGGESLPRKEPPAAAEALTAARPGSSSLAGQPSKGLSKATAGVAKVVRRAVEARTGELTCEL
jgi:hypothetical protein